MDGDGKDNLLSDRDMLEMDLSVLNLELHSIKNMM